MSYSNQNPAGFPNMNQRQILFQPVHQDESPFMNNPLDDLFYLDMLYSSRDLRALDAAIIARMRASPLKLCDVFRVAIHHRSLAYDRMIMPNNYQFPASHTNNQPAPSSSNMEAQVTAAQTQVPPTQVQVPPAQAHVPSTQVQVLHTHAPPTHAPVHDIIGDMRNLIILERRSNGDFEQAIQDQSTDTSYICALLAMAVRDTRIVTEKWLKDRKIIDDAKEGVIKARDNNESVAVDEELEKVERKLEEAED
jgi:hypothetical protein